MVFFIADNVQALRVQLCDEEIVIITIDPRTGKLDLRDTGDLAAAGRGPRFRVVTDRLNENPAALFEALFSLRGTVSFWQHYSNECLLFAIQTIIDLAEQKANYLGLQVYRRRSFSKQGQLVKHSPYLFRADTTRDRNGETRS